MIVGIQSGGIGKVDMSQTGGTTDKSKSKDKASGTFEDLMNLAATNPNTTTQTANSATMKNDVDAVKQADTTVSGEKKQSDLNKYTRSDAKTETTRTTGAEKAKRNEAPQEVESDDLKAELLSNKLKKLLNVDDETLQNLLQTAGLTMQDLLDPAVMKDFILQINDATSVDLLIDESLNNLMQQAMQLLDEVLNVVDETVISTEVPVEELLPEESSSAQTEPQETVVDAEKPQTVEAKTETVAQTTPEEDVTRTDGKSVETQTVDTEVQVTVQTEDSDASADMMKQNAEGVISNLNQAMAQATGEEIAATPFDTSVTQTDIVRQVVDEIRVNLSKDVTSMTLQLNPEQLGKVQIHVSTKNGVMQAQIIAETEAAKAAVESGLAVLKEAFENQDLKVDAIEVMVGTPDYFMEESGAEAQMEQKEQKSGNSTGPVNFTGNSDDDIIEDVSLETEMMKAQGNQVNYMA